MKATFEIPDDLYRSAKARSAREGRPLHSVAVELFQHWLSSLPVRTAVEDDSLTAEESVRFPWLKITRPYIRPGMSHDMDDIRESIARGWAAETAEKLGCDAHSS
jgi:hypothetical protein